MFISNKYKVLFVHIQKTGGNSVEDLFKKKDRKLILRIPVPKELMRTKHCFMSDIYKVYDLKYFDNFTKFCVVRNPFDRMVSWYSMFKYQTGVNNDVMKAVNERVSSFSDFINLPDEGIFHRFFVNQFDYISINNKIEVDEILRFEHLESQFSQLAQKIKLKKGLPHKNKSIRNSDYKEYYNSELRKIIEKRFKKDLEIFNYSFE